MNREGDSGEIMHPTAMAIAEGGEKHWTWIVEEGYFQMTEGAL